MIINNLDLVYDELKNENVHIYDKYDYVHKYKTNNKVKRLTLGRIWINCIFPDDFELIDTEVNDKVLNTYIKKLHEQYDDSKTIVSVVDSLNKESFKLGTIIPASFDIDSLIVPDFIIKKKNEYLTDDLSPDEFNKRTKSLSIELLDYLKENNSGLYNIIMSGAKGNPELFGALMIAKGASKDLENNISKPITHSFDEGFDLKEYYINAAEARYTQYEKSVMSQEPGYLARKIVFALSNILLDKHDCKTKKYLKLKITESIIPRIIGRYYLNSDGDLELITRDKNLKDQTIQLRSPIYCKSTIGICKFCFGQLAEKLNTKYIGILSGGVMNDFGVNGVMKLRHKANFINIKEVDFTKDIIL